MTFDDQPNYDSRSLFNYYLTHLPQTVAKFPEVDFTKAFHWTQMESKLWAAEELEKSIYEDGDLIYLMGAWYGTLASLIFSIEGSDRTKIRSFDINPSCSKIAESLHHKWLINSWRFKATTADITKLDYSPCRFETVKSDGTLQLLVEQPTLIINTSCEHIQGLDRWIARLPKDMKVLLQSNNYFKGEGHVNCHRDIEDFVGQVNLSEVYYKGTKNLQLYDRFMIVGRT